MSKDRLHFELANTERPSFDIFINNHNLITLVQQVELPFTNKENRPDSAGRYIGLSPSSLFLSQMYFLGDHASNEDDTLLLRCADCGLDGCASIRCQITTSDDIVVWDAFHNPEMSNPNRKISWDYTLLKFRFDRSAYQQEIHRFALFLQSNFWANVRLHDDPEFGWSIFIPHQQDWVYFPLQQAAQLRLNDETYTCDIVEVTRRFWYTTPPSKKRQSQLRQSDELSRMLILPQKPHLLYQWITQYPEMERLLRGQKIQIEQDKASQPQSDNVARVSHQNGVNATLQKGDSDSVFQLQPMLAEYRKYREYKSE